MLITSSSNAQTIAGKPYHEKYRPKIHFSPKEHWINDPNGMVYFNHTYHLFYQYYPGSISWGPMHWGHAVSKDLMHWQELPIALYPDSLGYIFSGSAVVDSNNTSGFGKNGKTPLVAIFTHHDPKGEKAGSSTFQNESIAYSLDSAKTWTKYSGNPVLKNPGIRDFRDPKVMWYAKDKKWIMTLATLDHVTFYSSVDLKSWEKESEFGKEMGAHGGVWECPDLFRLNLAGKTYWVLVVNLNPGGPNGGSATQYFIGQFDGNKFTTTQTGTKWLDYGPDEYAGVTWSNTGDRKIFLGWMSNWKYAGQLPTEKWRNAMTIPRELALRKAVTGIYLTSHPVKEISAITEKKIKLALVLNDNGTSAEIKGLPKQYILKFHPATDLAFTITLSNSAGEKLIFGYDKSNQRYFIDRSQSGKTGFNTDFGKVAYAPRIASKEPTALKLIVDASSIELFSADGLTVMTSLFFPTQPFNQFKIRSVDKIATKDIVLLPLKSIW